MDGYPIISELIDRVDSILIGSGAGLSSQTGELFNKIVTSTDKKIVIDADALKLVDKQNIIDSNTLVTPHTREFKEFFGCDLPDKRYDKIKLLEKLSKEYNTVILLKGVVDIVVSPDDYKLNSTGNQGMTVGGTGDLLAGLCVGISTRNTLYESAYISAFILGNAGDKLVEEYGFNYTSSDLLKII